MRDFFICPICGNKDPRFIGYKNGKPYCRKCISFKGEEAVDRLKIPKKSRIYLNYDLSDDQKRLSECLINNYKRGKNSFIHAVCGSGKTEIVLNVISYAIQCGDKVGFAVPRRDVAIELYERFSNVLKNNTVVLIFGGHHKNLYGDLVCLTTHQLYRYEKYFDLLIMDEVDAFPYHGNEVLQSFFRRSLKGKYILMSATINNELNKEIKKDGTEVLELFTRFHGHPLPVPDLINGNIIKLTYLLINLIRKFINKNKQIFIFVPTIEICERLGGFLKLFFRSGNYVHSKVQNRNEIISEFKARKYKFLVTTAVLERGVTVKDLQVIVYLADHKIYDRYSLIQIAGRAGRKKEAPEGEVIFLARQINDEILGCISEIRRANNNLQDMLP